MDFSISIDTKKPYNYNSSAIRPLAIQEFFPLKIPLGNNPINLLKCPPPEQESLKTKNTKEKWIKSLVSALKKDFNTHKKRIIQELEWRGIQESAAIYLYLNHFIHQSKHYTPREVKDDNAPFSNFYEYVTNLRYAHCGQKPYALKMLLEYFGLQSRVVSYSDILGWAHGFLEIPLNEKYIILDPTFNCLFNIGIEDIIKNPYCERRILSLYSSEFYTDSTQEYTNFIQTIIDNNTHTTFKYNREWFMFMGFYPFVPPVLTFHVNSIEAYDIRKDNRYTFI